MSANNQNKNTAKYNNKNQNKVLTQVKEVTSWNNSIFIPAIPFAVTKNQLKEAMESNLGKVHRIDFATFNSDNGSGRRAFVHFDQMHPTDFIKVLRQEISQKGHFDVSYPRYNMTLRILMNKNPVPETDKTIHQVASEIDFIGEKIRLHEETFLLMQEKNKALEEENKSMKQFMENMFHMMKSQEAMIQTLVNTVSIPMPMQPVFMPMQMPMPGYYPVPMPMPMPMNIVEEGNCDYDYDYDYEELEQGEISSSEEEDAQGEMKLSEIM